MFRRLLSATLLLTTFGASAAELRVLTHSSFSVDKKLIAEFEAQNAAKVSVIKAGDAGEMLNKLILTKSAPIADVVYGIDNLLVAKATDADVLVKPTPVKSPKQAFSEYLTTVDYGLVALNYDKAYVSEHKLVLPKSLDDFTKPQFKDLLVVENPATSSTGLAFMMATVHHLGKAKAWAFWGKLKANGVKVTQGWSDAYEKEFSKNGGTRPFVVSYSTSPSAEVFYSEGKLSVPPTDNLFVPGSYFMQAEGIGLVKGGKEAQLAGKFIQFMVSKSVQADLPTNMWMYPVREDVVLDKTFSFATLPTKLTKPVVPKSGKEVQQLVAEWQKLMRP
ncbi:thiamine ABC transporter substrate-binding protein [Leeia sp. TBRC 13508]|uniref:Thiamine ABC transporter substrate-binding protein n=1 Tax=Leeia speluncae TaxID=2884804 RepID=A0ABS8D8N7_9NEIS|nr:thiamine ABC transporter substrate-binding protein [Leeia speluncae]MCB6184487.1 thiamine ABC transporter substrate-binding protein [Leeia speluncae]